jgi:hypothetical protein
MNVARPRRRLSIAAAKALDRLIPVPRTCAEWVNFDAAVDVPQGAVTMVWLPDIEGQTVLTDVAGYDDVRVYRLD